MHKFSIVHVVPGITDEASGPSYSVTRLCESLLSAGENVTLASLDWSPLSTAPPFLKKFSLGWGPRRLGRSPGMERWLMDQAESRAVDLIHNHSLWMMPNVYPGRAARKYKIPLVVSPRGALSRTAFNSGSIVKKIFWPLLQKPAFDSAICFHATAKAECHDIRRAGFLQPVAIIPNGVDIPVLLPKESKKFRTLLFLGRIHPIKGLDMLLPAWGVLQDRFSDWRLRIVGPDDRGYLSEMRRLAGKLGLKRIEFAGAIYGTQKWQAYRDADLFVLPTYSENFGMAVAESLASSTPVIVTKGAPWSGLVTHQAGWWIDIGIDPLVACLEQALATTSHSLEAMGARGRKWVQSEYSWSHLGQKMAQTYHWSLDGCPSSRKPDWVVLD
jgi:glycosyltransferase involved in cell wall biosynthesis